MAFNVAEFRANMIGDGARPNLFQVTLTFPTVATNGVAAGQKTTFMAKSAQLPGSTVGTVPVFYFGRELKFAGNLRLIDKNDVAKRIMEYDKAGKEFEDFQERNVARTEEAAIQLENLFDARTFYFMLNDSNQIVRPVNNPQLISKVEHDINTLILRLQYVKGGTLRKINMAKRLQSKCIQLQAILKEQYHLHVHPN